LIYYIYIDVWFWYGNDIYKFWQNNKREPTDTTADTTTDTTTETTTDTPADTTADTTTDFSS
jgi:hypothetical protein